MYLCPFTAASISRSDHFNLLMKSISTATGHRNYVSNWVAMAYEKKIRTMILRGKGGKIGDRMYLCHNLRVACMRGEEVAVTNLRSKQFRGSV